MKLSILMPVYNERATLPSALKEVLNVDFPCEVEIVVVDDGSTDGTRDLYPSLTDDPRVKLVMHERNRGKGAAIRTAATAATGDYVIMYDADLEYSAAEIPSLLALVLAGEAEVTGKLLRRGYRPYEVPISYKARSRAAGKKLTWRDGAEALWILLRERAAARRA